MGGHGDIGSEMEGLDPGDAVVDPNLTRRAREILEAFGRGTGVTSAGEPRRYLWTDAFAVCGWLSLHRRTGVAGHLDNARALVEQVHRVLGRHREEDPREGWLSGMDEQTGAEHPTAGGLRIGKPLPERPEGESLDPGLEWERDGQYYHYLTRWMTALVRLAGTTGETRYLRYALELARAAHDGFVREGPDGAPRMAWKMSVDLSRPLVPSQGHHDPLDGLVVAARLRRERRRFAEATGPEGGRDELGPSLDDEVATLRRMVEGRRWATDDALGLGGLLVGLLEVTRLEGEDALEGLGLEERLVEDTAAGLQAVAASPTLRRPAERRLAFRELGLSLGLRAVERLGFVPQALTRHLVLADRIEQFWLDPGHREAPTWRDHLDINRVSLAVSLAPEGYLDQAWRSVSS